MDGLGIKEIAILAVKRDLPGFPTAPGWCTAFAFEVLARALKTNRWVLYAKILDSVRADPDRSRWAIDVERAVHRHFSWLVSKDDMNPRAGADYSKLLALLKPGDLLFSSKVFDEAPATSRIASDPEGHVGIYIGDYQGVPSVAENTRVARGLWYGRKNAMRITSLRNWDTVTTIARLPHGWKA